MRLVTNVQNICKLQALTNKLEIKTVIFCDDIDAPAQNFSNDFVHGEYNDKNKINEFLNKVDVVTYEFENIPIETIDFIEDNKLEKVRDGFLFVGRLSKEKGIDTLIKIFKSIMTHVVCCWNIGEPPSSLINF